MKTARGKSRDLTRTGVDEETQGDVVLTGIMSVSPIPPSCECCTSAATQVTLQYIGPIVLPYSLHFHSGNDGNL